MSVNVNTTTSTIIVQNTNQTITVVDGENTKQTVVVVDNGSGNIVNVTQPLVNVIEVVPLQDNNQTIVVVDNESANVVNVTQPLVNVIEVASPGPTGPAGPSIPFTNIGNGVYATTSSLQVTGPFLISSSTIFTNIGLAVFSGSTAVSGALVVNGFDVVTVNQTSSLTVLSASYAATASYVLNAVSSSFASTASFTITAQTASYVLNAVSSSVSTTASFADSASNAINAETASFVTNAISSSFASTASYALNAVSSSLATTASFATSASHAVTASYALVFPYTGTATITGSLVVSSSTTQLSGPSHTVRASTGDINLLAPGNSVNMQTPRVGIYDPVSTIGVSDHLYIEANTADGGIYWQANDEVIANYNISNGRYGYGNNNLYVSSSDNRTYSPSGFVGSLIGTASRAISASQASTASAVITVEVNDVPGNNATNYLAFYLSPSGFRPTRVASTKFVVNPATGSMGINKSTITTGYNLDVSGSVLVTGSITASLGFFGTASFATSASQALTASQATSASYALSASFAPSSPAFPYTGSAIISGSLGITGSLIVSGTNGGIDTSLNSPALLSGDGNQAVVFGTNRKWLNDANSTTVVDWEVQSLNDSLANPSIDWTNRILYEVGGYEALNYSTSASVSSQLYYNNVIPGQVQRQLANTPTHASRSY